MSAQSILIANKVNKSLERFMFALVLGSMGLGALLHSPLAPYKWFVPYAFGYMTLATSLGCSWRDFGRTFRAPLPMLVTLGMLHVLHPIIAKLLGAALYGPTSPYAVGLVLGAAVPTGVTSVLWAGMAGGSIPLSLTVVTADTILSPILVPLTVLLFARQHVSFDVESLMMGLFEMVVIPTIVGVTINDMTKGKAGKLIKPYANPFSKLAFVVVVAINVAAAWPHFAKLGSSYPMVLLGIAIMAIVGYGSSYLAGSLCGGGYETKATITYSAGMRNISAGIVIAMAYFPPLVAIPVVSSMLFQQPLATVVLKIINRFDSQSPSSKSSHSEPLPISNKDSAAAQ